MPPGRCLAIDPSVMCHAKEAATADPDGGSVEPIILFAGLCVGFESYIVRLKEEVVLIEEHNLEPTGYGVVQLRGRRLGWAREDIEGNKRGVVVAVYEHESGSLVGRRSPFVATLTYSTGWKGERPFTWMLESTTVNGLGDLIREKAKDLVPPGAGFPPLPQYEQRQENLRGRLFVVAIKALDGCLKQIAMR